MFESVEAGSVLDTAAGVDNHSILASKVKGASSPAGVPWAAAPESEVDVITAAGACGSILLASLLKLVVGGFRGSQIVLIVELEAGDDSSQNKYNK